MGSSSSRRRDHPGPRPQQVVNQGSRRRTGATQPQGGRYTPPPGGAQQQQQQPPPPQHHHQPPSHMPPHLMQHQHPSYVQQMMQHQQQMQGAGRAPGGGEVKDGETIRNLCTLHPKSVRYENGTLSFTCHVTTACTFEVHTGVREKIQQGVLFFPNYADAVLPPTQPLQEGEKVQVHHPLSVEHMPDEHREYKKQYFKQIPIAIVLRYTNPTTQVMCSEYTYVTLLPQVKSFKQLVQVGPNVFLVEHLYGIDHDEPTVAAVADGAPAARDGSSPALGAASPDFEDDDGLCVICLTNEKNTTVIPCRHMCLCRECAEQLRSHSPKCPVCRAPFSQLLSKS